MIAEPCADELHAIVDRHAGREGPLLPILHEMQDTWGHVPVAAVPVIAGALNLSAAEVTGVISFYHDFRKAPAGHHVLKICRAEACQAVGAEALAARVLDLLGIDWHGTTSDGAITVEPVFCAGLCACGPAVMMDGRPIGRVDEARARDLIAEARA